MHCTRAFMQRADGEAPFPALNDFHTANAVHHWYNAYMDDAARELLASKLRFSLAMSEDGFTMKRQQLRRRNPHADETEIDRLFRLWLQERPGAELEDTNLRPISWPPVRQ